MNLEVLDWGGSGRPVVLLAGLGNSARIFDKFAPKLARWYHVYGITRRGFGGSSAPSTGYSVDRLGQDVLAVMETLKIDRPVLIGHSVAGEELSYIGSHAPQKIAGLIYLDAGYSYAFYGPDPDHFYIDADRLQRNLTQILFRADRATQIALINQLLDTDLMQLREDLQAQRRNLQAGGQDMAQGASTPINEAIFAGMEKFTRIDAPILAIYADPHSPAPVPNAKSKADAETQDKAAVEAQIAALKRYNPSAQATRMPYANHYVFASNEAAVLGDVHAFIQHLPRSAGLTSN